MKNIFLTVAALTALVVYLAKKKKTNQNPAGTGDFPNSDRFDHSNADKTSHQLYANALS